MTARRRSPTSGTVRRRKPRPPTGGPDSRGAFPSPSIAPSVACDSVERVQRTPGALKVLTRRCSVHHRRGPRLGRSRQPCGAPSPSATGRGQGTSRQARRCTEEARLRVRSRSMGGLHSLPGPPDGGPLPTRVALLEHEQDDRQRAHRVDAVEVPRYLLDLSEIATPDGLDQGCVGGPGHRTHVRIRDAAEAHSALGAGVVRSLSQKPVGSGARWVTGPRWPRSRRCMSATVTTAVRRFIHAAGSRRR